MSERSKDADSGIHPQDLPVSPTLARSPRWLEFVSNRWFSKTLFLVFFLYSVFNLLRFEKWARGEGPYVARPESVGGVLPIGHFTSFFAWVRGGGWDPYLPAGLIIILMSLVVSLVFKRGFCGWVCPVGTVWEACSALGRRIFGRNFKLPRALDLIGRGLRYLFAGLFMTALLLVPLSEAVGFRGIPYMWVADLKIIHLMAEPTWLALAGLAALLSLFIGPAWCRYLCPLGGLYSAVGVASPCAIERNAETCINCHRCSAVCHAFVEPEKTARVISPECDGCMDCVRECPVEGCLEAKAFSRIRIAFWVWPLLVVGLWLIMFGFAKATDSWNSKIAPQAFQQIINSGLLDQKTRGFFE